MEDPLDISLFQKPNLRPSCKRLPSASVLEREVFQGVKRDHSIVYKRSTVHPFPNSNNNSNSNYSNFIAGTVVVGGVNGGDGSSSDGHHHPLLSVDQFHQLVKEDHLQYDIPYSIDKRGRWELVQDLKDEEEAVRDDQDSDQVDDEAVDFHGRTFAIADTEGLSRQFARSFTSQVSNIYSNKIRNKSVENENNRRPRFILKKSWRKGTRTVRLRQKGKKGCRKHNKNVSNESGNNNSNNNEGILHNSYNESFYNIAKADDLYVVVRMPHHQLSKCGNAFACHCQMCCHKEQKESRNKRKHNLLKCERM